MNFGPLEFADYLRKSDKPADSPAVRAARAARPADTEPVNLLTVLSVVVATVPGEESGEKAAGE